MKVLLVTPHFPSTHIGGVEIYTKRLADSLSAQGDQAEVVCVEQIDSKDTTLHAVRDTEFGYPVHRLYTNFSAEPDSFRATYHSHAIQQWTEALLTQTSSDVVHLQSGYLLGGAVLEAAFRCNVPTIVTLHDFWFICARTTLLHPTGKLCTGPDNAAKCAWCLATEKRRFRLPDAWTNGRIGQRVVRMLEHRTAATALGWSGAIEAVNERRLNLLPALARVDLILAPSRFLRDLMVQAGIPAGRIEISRFGMEGPVTRSNAVATRPTFNIGYLGQLAPHKGVHVLLDALASLPGIPFNVQIYGDPTRHQRYVSRLHRNAQKDRRITFHGAYSHEQVYEILGQLDAIVVPSLWYENSPLVIQEAQAARVPVIASRLGGMRELVTDEVDGLLFEPGNAKDLARQLRRLVDDPVLLRQFQSNGTDVRMIEDEIQELSAYYQRLGGHPNSSSRVSASFQRGR
jgi:glycosyltransferase involved in cell wall biosynthesis